LNGALAGTIEIPITCGDYQTQSAYIIVIPENIKMPVINTAVSGNLQINNMSQTATITVTTPNGADLATLVKPSYAQLSFSD
jgi:hypothetical protein